jgi:hypothetical protein
MDEDDGSGGDANEVKWRSSLMLHQKEAELAKTFEEQAGSSMLVSIVHGSSLSASFGTFVKLATLAFNHSRSTHDYNLYLPGNARCNGN